MVVDQQLVRLAQGIGIGPLKTRSSYRTVPLPQVAADHLAAHLRHYFASALIRSGASVKVVQARLGHASAKTTLDVYGHLFPDEEDRTRTAMDLGGCRRSYLRQGRS